MNIFGNILKKKNKTLIIAYDGAGIWGVTADKSGVKAEHHFPAKTELKNILEFGKEQHVRNVLVLQTAEIRELEVKLGADLSDDERRSAIEYAAASNISDHSGSRTVSYMDGMFHDFRSGTVVSYFDTEEIVSISNQIKGIKANFLGITNFKQLLLAQHFSDPQKHADAFLFLLDNHGAAAIPERNRLVIRNLPFGVPAKECDSEWIERAKRRLHTLFKDKRVYIYTPEQDRGLCNLIREISGAETVESLDWESAVSDAALYFLTSGHELIHPALPPPKEKDPKSAGTFIGIFLLAATIASLGFLIIRNHITRYIFQRDTIANQKIIDAVKQEKNAVKNLENQLAGEQEIFAVMKQKPRISKDYILVMNLLSRYPLQYTKITSIEERANGIFISGESVWQPDLSRFFAHFENKLSQYGLTLFSDGLSKEKDGRIVFRSHVAPSGEKRHE